MTKNMNMKMRLLCVLAVIAFVFSASAQNNQDIVSSINRSGKVTIALPDGLSERNNNDFNKSNKGVVVAKTEEETVTTDETKHVDPKSQRSHTLSQTIQGRSVGYRIQVYNDGSANAKANAQSRARTIAMKFPQYRTYITYNAPTWRLRLGDFKNQGDAQAALSRIRSVFPQFAGTMMLVKDNINVWSR